MYTERKHRSAAKKKNEGGKRKNRALNCHNFERVSRAMKTKVLSGILSNREAYKKCVAYFRGLFVFLCQLVWSFYLEDNESTKFKPKLNSKLKVNTNKMHEQLNRLPRKQKWFGDCGLDTDGAWALPVTLGFPLPFIFFLVSFPVSFIYIFILKFFLESFCFFFLPSALVALQQTSCPSSQTSILKTS